ncbi:MAG: UDP-N-acetylmuramoyl-L-alanyl-D-glutamate--2,6-diaminopimelate ligase [Woeseiaceae bacterium]
MTSQQSKISINLNDLLHDFITDDKFNDITVSGLTLDSRKVNKNDLFIAMKGESVNGMEFINHAIEHGASAVLWETGSDVEAIKINWRKTSLKRGELDIAVPIIAIENLHKATGELTNVFYAKPSEQLSVCGITGTNGKTSCANFIAQMMSIDVPCGLMGTLGQGIYPNVTETGFTTPDVIMCHKWLSDVKESKAKFAVMEVSSHALSQGRVEGIHFESAVFTNLSRDHLDYHGDMESYAEEKEKLFQVKGLKNAIINVDDEVGRDIAKHLSQQVRCIRYGTNKNVNPDVYAENIKLDDSGLSMFVTTPWGKCKLQSPLIGDFNVSNLLAVLSVMLLQNIEFNIAIERLSLISSVAGRMQQFGGQVSPLVVVDFAHTPDALEQALSSLRQHTKNDLWCVFGCGGNRDQGKRPLMGAIAEKQADFIVLTNDNPRTESADKILKDIQSGIKNNENVVIEQDRHAAIHLAISKAKTGDVVLIAGKGHENYQLIGDTRLPFNDAEEVKQQLEARVG